MDNNVNSVHYMGNSTVGVGNPMVRGIGLDLTAVDLQTTNATH